MSDLTKSAAEIEARIATATPSDRVTLLPDLEAVLRKMTEAGLTVPARLRNLEAELNSEVIEARFDNVPL